jgi:serine/threonine protein kinase
LLKDRGETKIYACKKGKGKGAVKIGPWSRIERESSALKALYGPGVVRLFKSDKIENSPLGYLILERLNPLPKRIETPYELQDITEAIMTALARIHDKNYIHRDVKRSNIMQHGKNIKLIDFECAITEDAEDFDICYGTNFYKPRELMNSHTPFGYTQTNASCEVTWIRQS